jgi:uncharacterized protein (TIGR02598 family)
MRISPRKLLSFRLRITGFSLVEVVMALGILAFAITALLGAFAVGMNTDRESIEELEATHILQSLLAERRANPVLTNTNMLLPVLSSNSVISSSNALSLDEIGRLQPGTRNGKFGLLYRVTPSPNTNSAAVYCAIYWPGRAKPENAAGRVEMTTRIALP